MAIINYTVTNKEVTLMKAALIWAALKSEDFYAKCEDGLKWNIDELFISYDAKTNTWLSHVWIRRPTGEFSVIEIKDGEVIFSSAKVPDSKYDFYRIYALEFNW